MARLALTLLALVLVACGAAPEGARDDTLQVVATTSIVGDVVASVAGDAAEVSVLIPPGVDAHGFAPSARDAARLREADLVVAVGLGLEEGLADPIAAAEEDGVPVLRIGEKVDPLPVGGHAEDDHAGDDHDHGSLDPHVWFDPVRMADAAELIGARLAAVARDDEPGDAEWARRAARYAEELRSLHEEVVDLLSAIPDGQRHLVTDHDNLRYFAERYGFEVVGTIVPGTSSQTQPSTREVVELAVLVGELGVPAIFTDASVGSDRLAAVLAEEVGRDVAIVELYTETLGEEGSGAETLIGMLRTDAQRIADALG